MPFLGLRLHCWVPPDRAHRDASFPYGLIKPLGEPEPPVWLWRESWFQAHNLPAPAPWRAPPGKTKRRSNQWHRAVPRASLRRNLSPLVPVRALSWPATNLRKRLHPKPHPNTAPVRLKRGRLGKVRRLGWLILSCTQDRSSIVTGPPLFWLLT